MKKIGKVPRFSGHPTILTFLRIMKCTIAILLLACLQVSANGFSQNRISVRFNSVDIRKALSTIEKKSSYRFLYNQKLVTHIGRVELQADDEEVMSVLTRMFDNTPVSFQLLANNLVVLKARNTTVADVTVSGKVVNVTGQPIIGASVTVKDSNVGTSTDAEGNFSLTVPDNATLVVSSVGFETQEVAVNARTTINITLQESTGRSMDEVVVIGYGTASKRDLTGSIVKIAGREVADKPNANPVAALQGRVAGLSVVNTGTPGKEPDIRIRGTSSIGGTKPLYVVDGIFQDNINYLNPNDIESLEILKDPSSLAIFGVRGATGVIAITTKRAKAGQVSVNFSANYGFKKLVDKIELVDAEGFATLFAEERANNGVTDPFDYTGLDANTDWINAVTQTGQFLNSNISVSASTEKNRFNLGIGYTIDEGIVRHEKLDRININVADEFKVNNAIKLGINLNVSRQKNPYDATFVLDDARKVIPQVSSGTTRHLVKNPYGTDTIEMDLYSGLDVGLQAAGVVNPLLYTENEHNSTKAFEYRTVGSIFGELTFLRKFNWRSTLYADISNLNQRIYNPLYYATNPKNNDEPYLYSQLTTVGEDDNTWRKFQQDHVLTYKNDFGQHGLTLTGGFTTYYFSNYNRRGEISQAGGATALPIPNDPRFWYITTGFEGPGTNRATSSQTDYGTVSYLARALYNYQGKYFLNASFRNDASSRLPEHTRNQQFWAVGAAWEVSREDFMSTQSIFDLLKLKASVGVLGNQTASTDAGVPLDNPFYANLNFNVAAVFGPNVYTAADPAYIPNPDLRWETIFAREAGVELVAFQNRLNLEANYFIRTTRDLMTYVSRAPQGLKDMLVNGGSIRNNGLELAAGWTQNFTDDLSLNLQGNITFLENKVVSMASELTTGFISRRFNNNGSAEARTTAGYPVAAFWGYVVEGLYQSQTDIEKSPDATGVGGVPKPGDFKFKDVTGDGVVDARDRTFIGSPTPDIMYGTTVNLTFKGLTLSVDLNGVYGNEVFRTWGSLESPFQRVNYAAEKLNRWNGPGTSNWTPIISQEHRFNYNGSTYNIEDGSYFRIRNVQLGYNLPTAIIQRANIKALRVYANVQNLKTFKNNLGYTPEFGGESTAFGFDNAGGAIPVVGTLGINVTF
jgi:TonB-linked SusC/RagA family outer membrane protein